MLIFLLLLLLSTEALATCPVGECEEFNRGCVPSVFSTRCNACSNNGHIEDGRCVCLNRLDDPERACLPLAQSNSSYQVDYETTWAVCECASSDSEGYFLPITDYDYKFGAENPPTCSQCLSDVFGVKPGQGPAPCTSYGGVNPNLFYSESQDTSWWQCGGNGYWDSTTYSCVCYPGWKLTNTGKFGRNGTEPVFICTSCEDFWGPPPPTSAHDLVSFYPPTYCRGYWTPNPLTGEFAICSGNGEFREGRCWCFQNSTTQWQLYEYAPGIWSCLNATAANVTASPVTT